MTTKYGRAWAAVFAAALLLPACEGSAGKDGAAGPQGDAGAQGAKGDKGEPGAKGDQGDPGPAGDKGDKGDKGDSGPAGPKGEVGPTGAKGDTGPTGEKGDKGDKGEKGDKGDPGQAAPGLLATEPSGVVGIVEDGGHMKLTSGTIYFVPAADVAALPPTTLDPKSDNDEPLEDLIAKNAVKYTKATINAKGEYALKTLPDGKWFVTYIPDAKDAGHLPGGDLCRTAMTTAQLKGGRFDIRVSDSTPAGAEYVGTGRCVTCHGKKHIARTVHRLGIWSPYEHGPLQDMSLHKDELWGPLNKKFTITGTKVYFHAYDSKRGFDKFKTSETDPGKDVAFTATVRKKGNDYQFVLENVLDPKDPNSPMVLKVDAIYGGGVYKMRYLTRVNGKDGKFLVTLPLQFNQLGKDDKAYPRTSQQWRDYHSTNWYNIAKKKLITSAAQEPKHSFEKNCMSCHAASATITGSDSTVWKAEVVSDPVWGDWDYNGDGIRDEMNVGCETCHGPGSAHWNATGQGKNIVIPTLLTPSRETMICGRCHSRPKGALGSDAPVNKAGKMLVAGMSRAKFLAEYATTQMDGAPKNYWGDAKKHSKSHHQQYSDFIRGKMYKNDTELLTCSECHNPHQEKHDNLLRFDRKDNKAACGGCHTKYADDLASHLKAKLGDTGSVMKSAACVDCHMAKMAKSGAGKPGIRIGSVQYWQGDISNHMFDVPSKSLSKGDASGPPTPYTNACGICHKTAIK